MLSVDNMDLVQEFQVWQVSKGYLSPSTATAYVSDIRLFERWLSRHRVNAQWSKVCAADIEDYIAFMVSEEYEYSSICRSLSALSSIFSYFCHVKGLSVNPVASVKRPRPVYHQREALDMEVIRMVLSQDRVAISTKALIALIAESGLRIGECLSLSVDDVNLEYRQIRIMGKGRVERIVYFGEVAAKWLAEYLRECPRLSVLFPNSRRQYNWDIWHACKPFAGEKKCSPHILRHSFATESLSKGMPMDVLMLTLGHKSIETTMIYTHCQSERVSKYNHQSGARL